MAPPPQQTSGSTSRKPTLTQDTVWNLRLVLRGVSTQKGQKVDEMFVVAGHFVEEPGYEPPQGSFVPIAEKDSRLKVVNSRWQLSEDPDDRKDGLWVWGLFQEPLYPFLLLRLETDAVPLAGSSASSEDQADAILPLQLFAQVGHKRDDGAVILEGTTELKVRQMETINADPFGAAKVDLYKEVSIGRLSLQPVV